MKARAVRMPRSAVEAARRSVVRTVAGEMARSRGVPLAPDVRAILQPAIGHDLARIRIHSDDAAARASQALGAEAFASGAHLFFAPRRFGPETSEGRRLLAHELAHSVQQGQGALIAPQPLRVTAPGDALERQADAVARDVSSGRSLAPGALAADQPAARGVVGRFAIFALAFEHLLESVDPGLTEQRLATETLQIFESDPLDKAGRVRNQLERLDPRTRKSVMERIHERATADQWTALSRLLEQSPSPGAEQADVSANNIIPLPARPPTPEGAAPPAPAPLEPASAEGKVLATPAKEDEAKAKPGGEADKKEEEAKPEGPSMPRADGGPEPEAAAAPGTPPAPKEAVKAGAAGPGGPPAGGAGGADTADLSAAEKAGLPNAAEAERQPPAGAVTAPAEAPERPRPVEPQPGPVPAAAESGPALPGSEHAAAAEIESAVNTEEASGARPAPAGTVEPRPPIAPMPSPAAAPAAPPAMAAEAAPAEVPQTADGAAGSSEAVPEAAPAASTEAPAPAPAEAEVQETPPPAQPGLAATQPETMAAPAGVVAPAPPIPGEPPAPEPEEVQPAEVTPPAGPTPAEAVSPPAAEAPPAAAPAVQPDMPTAAPEPEAPVAAPVAPQAAAPPPATGICAMVAPAAEPEGGEGMTCGGGGEAAAAEPPAPEPATAPAADPVQAVSQAEGQSPAQVQQTMCGAADSANQAVEKQQEELAANAPTMERPSGAPADKDGAPPPPPPPEPVTGGAKAVERVPAGAAIPAPPPEAIPAPPPSPVSAVRSPAIPGESKIDERAAQQVKEAVQSLPVSDPGLDVTAGTAPQVELTGDADPAQGKEQREKLDKSAADAKEQGRQDAAQPLGENDVYPRVPKETLRSDPKGETAPGDVPACSFGPGSGGDCAKGDTDETTSIVAKEQRGDEINAAVGRARQDMVKGQEDHTQKVDQAKTDNQRQIDEEVKKSAQDQTDARSDLRKEVGEQRGKWTDGQRDLSDKAQADADTAGQDADGEITKQQHDANAEAAGHYDDANKKIKTERENAEKKAEDKRKEGEKESSGGLLSKIGSAVSSFFEGIKNAINAVFDLARKAVKGFIEAAQKLAAAVIDKARGLIVAAIHKLGDALIAIGDRLLADFPGLRDKFRGAIRSAVSLAEKAVNLIADKLKKGVQALLNLLGKVLDAYLCLLRAVYLTAVDAVQSYVKAALDFAKAVVQGFLAFAQLIKDIAAGPGDWLRKLGRAVVDGIKNCLWSAFKRAVKEWFNSKLEEVLGLGLLIIRILCQGGISFAQIGKMAWEGLKAAIPGILIQLLIEKLVAMIVPAAGAILTIIEGLKAAWGTVSRILRAFELFFKFLKAVKTGNAAGPFAEAVAAAAIVVIDFVANWLIGRLKRPAGAISGRLKGMADAFKRVAGGAKRVAGRVVRAVGRAARAVGRGIVRGVRAVGRGLRTAGRAVLRGVRTAARAFAKTKVGAALIKGARKFGHWAANTRVGKAMIKAGQAIRRQLQTLLASARRKYADWRERRRQRAEERRMERERRRAERRAAARPETQAALDRMLASGVPDLYLKLQLLRLRLQYGWKSLRLVRHPSNGTFVILGRLSPEDSVTDGSFVLHIIMASPIHVPPEQKPSEDIGYRYQIAAGRQYVQGPLARELFPGGIEVTYPPGLGGGARRTGGGRSPLDVVRLNYEMSVRKGKQPFRPDFRAEVPGRDPTSGRRLAEPTTVHYIEITAVTEFVDMRRTGGEGPGGHKVGQFLLTLQEMASHPRYQSSRLVYTFIAPGEPGPATRQFIKNTVERAGLAHRVQIVWRVVPIAS